jgi:uncharacterized membrane protein YccC
MNDTQRRLGREDGWRSVARLPGIGRLAALREAWPDALRMVLATVLAASISIALRLPETYWAVLSAIIVSRPTAGSSTRAGASRLIGTVFGSAVAMAVIVARTWHVPEILLLAVAMVPLSLLVTAFEEYRTAPVAAIIILSSGSALISPLHLALLRLAEIAIGSLASTLIGAWVMPSRGHGRVFRMSASILARIGAVLDSSFEEPRVDARLDAAHDDIRRDLREVAVLVRTKVGRGAPRAQGRIVKLLSRLHADALFTGRVVGSGLRRASALEYAQALHEVCREVAGCMLEPESAQAELQRCREALRAASEAFALARQPPGGAALDALDFLLDTLGKDLHDLMRVLQGPR